MTDPRGHDDKPPAAPTFDPLGLYRGGEGLITGTVVCASVIAAAAGHIHSTARLTLAIFGTVFVYWLAHLHARAIGSAVADQQHPYTAVGAAVSHTWPVAAASLLPICVLLVADVAGATLRTAAWIALWATIGLLGLYSYLAGRRGGLGTWGSVASACAGAALGVLIVGLKAALH
ncbi:hypothetical protein [Solicola gregarius]|uniref:Uncharacterized protein n=1 Tax=Solicola gregarius TaxID=2908642 RepID=A0AA46TI91_9ACTN|nr:hypothetical protein [Solicola gregarius]UYM05643.1 hypothetical protein L0C25_00725 [Solicola gregarius]